MGNLIEKLYLENILLCFSIVFTRVAKGFLLDFWSFPVCVLYCVRCLSSSKIKCRTPMAALSSPPLALYLMAHKSLAWSGITAYSCHHPHPNKLYSKAWWETVWNTAQTCSVISENGCILPFAPFDLLISAFSFWSSVCLSFPDTLILG